MLLPPDLVIQSIFTVTALIFLASCAAICHARFVYTRNMEFAFLSWLFLAALGIFAWSAFK